MKVIFIVTLIILLISFIITLVVHIKQFGKRIEDIKKESPFNNIEDNEVKFFSGKNELTGHFYFDKSSQKENNIIIIFVNGYGLTHKDYSLEIEEFVKLGFTVFAYDMTGCGESLGKKINGFSQFIIDAEAAVNFVSQRNIFSKIILIGHSTGGYAAAATLNIDNIKVDKAVIIAGFNKTGQYVRRCVKKNLGIFSYLIGFWVYVIEFFKFSKISRYTAINGANKFLGDVLVIQGDKDKDMYDKGSLYSMKNKAKRKNIKFTLVQGADHYPLIIENERNKKINRDVFKDLVDWIYYKL